MLANFTAPDQAVDGGLIRHNGLELTGDAVSADGRPLATHGGDLVLAPYQFLWIAA